MSIKFHHPETLGMSISGHTWRDEVIAQINNDPTYQEKALECSELFLAAMSKKLEKAAPGYAAAAVKDCSVSVPRYEYIKNVGPDEEHTACIDLLLHVVTFSE